MRRCSQGCRPRQSQSSGQDADSSSGAACAVRPHRSSLWGAAYPGHHRPCSHHSLSATELLFAQRGEGFPARPLLAGIVTSGVAGGNDAVWRSHPRRDVLVLCETDQINTMKSPWGFWVTDEHLGPVSAEQTWNSLAAVPSVGRRFHLCAVYPTSTLQAADS